MRTLGRLGIFAAIAIGYGAFMSMSSEELAPTEQEKLLVLKASDVAVAMEGFTPDPSAERIVKTEYFDGSYEIQYEYNDPREDAPYIYSTATYEGDTQDAMASYVGLAAGESLGFNEEGVALQEVEGEAAYSWGDQSSFSIITFQEQPVGNTFRGRHGNVVVDIQIVGLYSETGSDFNSLVGEVLERAAKHR